MKSLLPIVIIVFLFAACSPGSSSETSSDSTLQASVPTAEATPTTFVNWMEVGVRDSPSEKGKYVTTVYLAETLELLGDTASEISGKNRVHYNKVRLLDGKECWIRTDFIAIGSNAAVLVHAGNIFSRPDRVAVTGKQFEEYDVIAVKPVEGKENEWYEAKGKAKGENWFTHGYIMYDDVLTDETEVQFAALLKRANAAKDQKMKEALEAQLQDQQFVNTNMYAWIYGPVKPEDAGEGGDYSEQSDESDAGDNGEESESVWNEVSIVQTFLEGKWQKSSPVSAHHAEMDEVEITSLSEYKDGGPTLMMTEFSYDEDEFVIHFVITNGSDIRLTNTLKRMDDGETLQGTEVDSKGVSKEVTYTRVQ